MANCQFECKLKNETFFSEDNALFVNPIDIDQSKVNSSLVFSSFLGISLGLIAICFVKGNPLDQHILFYAPLISTILFFSLLVAQWINKDWDLSFESSFKGKINDGFDNKDVLNIYSLNCGFWICMSFIITFYTGIIILQSKKNDVIIESRHGLIFNFILLIIPFICWFIIYGNTRGVLCENEDVNAPKTSDGTLPVCRIQEDYLIIIQTIYGILICGLITILSIIVYSLYY